MISMWIASVLLIVSVQSISSAPIPVEMIDMTHVFDNDTLFYPYPTLKKFEIHVLENGTNANGHWIQMEEYSSNIHVGTHMDAPCHFGRGRWTVDEIPLKHLIAPAAVIDITQKASEDRDYLVTIQDLEEWERRTEHTLDGTIVLIKSGWGNRWGNRESFTGTPGNDTSQLHFPGMSEASAQWLVDNRSIYGLGTECLSLDGAASTDWGAHKALLNANIFGLENVANVGDLPMIGATLYVMPMKIGKGSGAPVRIIATYPKVLFHNDARSVTERSLREVIIFS